MLKTALNEAHKAAQAKMGPFAGYEMPLYYGEGVIKEHEWVRASCGLFDVSHMGQAMIKGPGALALIETLTPSSFAKFPTDKAKYTLLLNERGGIIDDVMVTKTGQDWFHFVLNAGRKHEDIAWIKAHLPEGVAFTHYDDWALLALQGPQAESVAKEALGHDLSALPYMGLWCREDYKMFISRLGYTGEDGFEIALPNADAPALWGKLLEHKAVKPIGLAARDSLRLEMGYCLYGHDIDEDTSPIEADLSWVIGKNNAGFIGAETVLKQREDGASRKRVGIKVLGKGIAREGAEIRSDAAEMIGILTSGGFSPTLGCAIGQGYVPVEMATPGTKIFVNVRGRDIAAEVATMPFMPAKTKSMKKKA